jgi:hypothetical protein
MQKSKIMLPKFFRTYKHKQFNYMPLYYNQQKEELEERVRRIENELQGKPTGEYKPGIIKGSFKHLHSMRKKSNRVSSVRLIVIILVLIALVYYLLKL